MTTKLQRPFKRELDVNGEKYTLTVSPEGFKLVLKGKRKGGVFGIGGTRQTRPVWSGPLLAGNRLPPGRYLTCGEQAFLLCAGGHHHHLTCRVCGRVEEVRDIVFARRLVPRHEARQVAVAGRLGRHLLQQPGPAVARPGTARPPASRGVPPPPRQPRSRPRPQWPH